MTSVIDLISTPIGERSQSVVMALLGKQRSYVIQKGIRMPMGEIGVWNRSLRVPCVFFINENAADSLLGIVALSGEPMNRLTNYKVTRDTDDSISVVGLDIRKLPISLNRIPKWDLPLVGVFNFIIVNEDFTCV